MTYYEINSKEYEVEYDLENRIVKVEVGNQVVEYRYDALGRRVIRKQGSTKSALIWWGNSECAEHKHQAGQTVIQNDIMEHPSRLNSVIARAVDGSKFKLEWYHKNYLDHVYAVSDDSGDILEHYRYTAFGEVSIYNANGNQVVTSQIDNHILWNTRRRDEVTGYYMYKYRHYSAELGRWPSRDPIEEDGGVNLYAFVGNDGINNWDMLGLKMDLYFVPGDPRETRLSEQQSVTRSNAKASSASIMHRIVEALGFDFSLYKIHIKTAVDANGDITLVDGGPGQGLVPNFETEVKDYDAALMAKIFRNEQQSSFSILPFNANTTLNDISNNLANFVNGNANYDYDYFTLTAHGNRNQMVVIGGVASTPLAQVTNMYQRLAVNYKNANHAICGSRLLNGQPATCVTETVEFEINYDHKKCVIEVTPAQSGSGGLEPFPPENE